ncbi:hypothetical protein H072_2991 [Dactylellina haptotyla CBS 200.50]|uniref:Cytochrome b-c1 complex subunit 2, mitochondrial n=1 Tax=Dactylellina haptotyla (strain CBS 200.50) TaxID=1284197 RepID=S8BU71_DACHA|nr:hypothetical protein H072_2991 [Dactylellina haptotyla CBS 200.50]
MLPVRNAVARGASRQWLKSSSLSPIRHTRAFASATTAPFTYEVSDATGTKVVSKDTGSPTASLAVVIKAGSRYQPLPGISHALEHFAFKSTSKRTALFITREVELMGGVLETSLSRENIVYKARFLRGDLPYFVELLGDAVTKTKFHGYEYTERVIPALDHEVQVHYSDPSFVALEAAHASAYHHGLGLDKLSVVRKSFGAHEIADFAAKTFNKGNLSLVGSGVSHSEVTKYAGEFFGDLGTGSQVTGSAPTYYGGETRSWSKTGNAVVIAFPGSAGGPAFKPEFNILSYLLGGESTIKWSPGNSLLGKAVQNHAGVSAVARNIAYSDTGLFYISVSGPATNLKAALPDVVAAVKNVSSLTAEDLKRAIQNAKFDFYSAAEENALSMESIGQSIIATGKVPQVQESIKALEGVTLDSVKKATSTLLAGKAAVGTVGDLHILPYACDIGLNV